MGLKPLFYYFLFSSDFEYRRKGVFSGSFCLETGARAVRLDSDSRDRVPEVRDRSLRRQVHHRARVRQEGDARVPGGRRGAQQQGSRYQVLQV